MEYLLHALSVLLSVALSVLAVRVMLEGERARRRNFRAAMRLLHPKTAARGRKSSAVQIVAIKPRDSDGGPQPPEAA